MQQDIDTLKQYALDNSLSIAQLRSVTKGQVETVLGRSLHAGYFSNLCHHVRKRVSTHRDQVSLQGLKDRLTANTWLANNYPDAEFEIRDRIVKIWLDGKPEALDE